MPKIHLGLNPLTTFLGYFLVILIVSGSGLLTAVLVMREKPAFLFRPKAPKLGKSILLEKIPGIWKKLRFSDKITIRNIFRYKRRVVVTICGIIGCTALMLAGFGLKDAIVDISAADYVPDQAIVRVYKPGALRALMIKNGIQKKPHLKIEGSINKNDVAWLHQLSMYDDLNKRYGSIKTLDLSNTDMTYLPDSSFFKSGSLVYIKLPHNLHTIGLAAFKESICLNNVDIPSSVRNIRMDAFARCGNLLDITIPEGVHKVLSGSFFGCVFLTDVKLPSTIDTIGYYAFANCYRLTRLQIPAATKLIGPKITTGDRNVEIIIDPNNAYFYVKNGAIYRREDNKSIDVPIKYKGDLKPNPYQHLYEDGYAYKTTYKIVNGKKVKLKTVRYKIKQ